MIRKQVAALGNSFDFSIVICQSFSLKLGLHSFAFVMSIFEGEFDLQLSREQCCKLQRAFN